MMDPTDDAVFTAELEDITTMSKVLQELHHAGDHAVLNITREGMKFVSADEKTFQVSAHFTSSIFQRFKLDEETLVVNFRFMLRDFIECLNLLRDTPTNEEDNQQSDILKTSLYIQYRAKGDPLRLRMENNSNYVINCDLKAFNLMNSMFCPLVFIEDDYATIMMDSKKLQDFVSGLDLNSSESLKITLSKGPTPIKMSTRGLFGEVELEITSNESDIIIEGLMVSVNCWFSFSYKTQFIKPALEALRASSTVRIKCATSGLLCVEHQINRSSVEYFILCDTNTEQ